MSELVVNKITYKAEDAVLVDAASYRLGCGELVALLGPNGAGKTSLLRASLGLEAAVSGTAMLDRRDVASLSPMQRARSVAYLPQIRPLAWPNLVRDVVGLGRFSYGASLGKLRGADLEAVETALSACNLGALAERRTDTLSGGELARVHFARALAAKAPLLIADEPVAALDPLYQFQVMDLVQRFVEAGGGAMVVLHEVTLAARYATRIIWMKDGQILADGKTEDLLTPDWIARIYGVRAKIDGSSVIMLGPI